MNTGIPRTHHEVVRAARDLGYGYDHTSGGHVFYTKTNPDKKLGQEQRLVIPTDIKTEKTLRNILNGMGYFPANGLNKNGQPLKRDKIDAANDEGARIYKLETRFITESRDWKKEMQRHARGIVSHPGPQPKAEGFEPSPFGPRSNAAKFNAAKM